MGRHSSYMCPFQTGLKEGDALSSLLLRFVLEYAIRKVQEHQEELRFSTTCQLLDHAIEVNIVNIVAWSINKG